MKRNFRPIYLLTIFMVALLLAPTALFGIKPYTALADDSGKDIFTALPESSPGGLTITWYSAKRYNQHKSFIGLFTSAGGIYDKAASTAAYNNYDHSVDWGTTEKISDLSFNMSKWVKAEDKPKPETFDTWVWGEVKGYMKMPGNYNRYLMQLKPSPNTNAKFSLILGDKGHECTDADYYSDSTYENVFPSKNEFVPFCLRIGCFNIDPSKTNNFSLKFGWQAYDSDWKPWSPKGNITSLYSKLALKDMQRFFKFDSTNYCFTLDPGLSFSDAEYEYGVLGGTNFKPVKLGTNYIDPDTGDVIVRYKAFPHLYITLGSISVPKVSDLKVTGRTTTTASLSWSAPSGNRTPTGYDIYRQAVDISPGFSYNRTITAEQPHKVGSTSGLTFADQGLGYDTIYQYYVKAQYSKGYSAESNIVKTDTVTEGIPTTPTDLRVSDQTQTSVKLQWGVSNSKAGIKEYIIYRNITSSQVKMANPSEIGRSSTTSFVDSHLSVNDTCEYSVQAVDKNGVRSCITSLLEVSVKDLTPPTVPIVTTTTLPDSTAGSSYSSTLKAEGGTSVMWSVVSGGLPDGLSLDEKTGVISGTPTSAGTYTFTVKATNAEDSN